jgi:hypothetical protein
VLTEFDLRTFQARGRLTLRLTGTDVFTLTKEPNMQIDKEQIISLLRERGDDAKADQAQQELPGKVDTDQDAGLLSKLGIDPSDLLGGLGGGLGGKLGL